MRHNEVQIPKPSKKEKKNLSRIITLFSSCPPKFLHYHRLAVSFLFSALLHCRYYEANRQVTIYNEEGPKSLWVRMT